MIPAPRDLWAVNREEECKWWERSKGAMQQPVDGFVFRSVNRIFNEYYRRFRSAPARETAKNNRSWGAKQTKCTFPAIYPRGNWKEVRESRRLNKEALHFSPTFNPSLSKLQVGVGYLRAIFLGIRAVFGPKKKRSDELFWILFAPLSSPESRRFPGRENCARSAN